MSSNTGSLSSMLAGKCPQCHKGKVFKHNMWNLFKSSEVHVNCPYCGVKFEQELGFFWGAMYFSYALNVAVSVITGFSMFFFFGDPDLYVYLLVIVPLIIILTPFMLRFSRLLMMYVASSYRKYQPGIPKHP